MVPNEPVVNVKTGHVYERRLVTAHVAAHGTDPVSREPASIADFIELKTSPIAKPRPVAALSVTGILSALQSEWDGLMLETFQLRQALDATRTELSQALYQQDAACRVISKLVKERDAARSSLTNAQSTLAQRAGSAAAAFGNGDRDTEMTEDGGRRDGQADSSNLPSGSSSVLAIASSIPENILTAAKDIQKSLAKERKAKNKNVSSDLSSLSELVSASGGLTKLYKSFSIHSPSSPEITCLDSHPVHKNLVITGGKDKSTLVFDLHKGEVVSRFNRGAPVHSKAITSVAFHPTRDICVSASLDGLIKVWAPNSASSSSSSSSSGSSASSSSNYDVASSFRSSVSGSEVTGLSMHPLGDYAVSSNKEASWSFSDLNVGRVLATFSSIPPSSETYENIRLHPDGLLVAMGTSSHLIKIFDLRSGEKAASFSGHNGPIRTISFGENGFSFASGSNDGARLWDLRKQECTRHIPLENSTSCSSVVFDESSQYVAIGGSSGRISLVDIRAAVSDMSSTAIVASISAHKGSVTGLSWLGSSAKTLVSTSLDGSLAHYGAAI